MPTMNINKVANGVVHPTTKETITKYQKLIDEPLLRDVCMRAMYNKLGIGTGIQRYQRYKYDQVHVTRQN